MNDDDGMMLNFAVPAAGAAVSRKKTKLVGGKWSERRKEQLKQQGRGGTFEKKQQTSGGNDTPIGQKRPRLPPVESGIGQGSTASNGQIVTSLFTANKEIKTRSNEQLEIQAPSNSISPDATFADMEIHSNIKRTLETLKFEKPTKIQRLVIPKLQMATNDIFMQAQTGSGKTLAFVLPILDKLLQSKEKITRQSGIYALILTPTRELAQQIYGFLEEKLCRMSCNWIVPGIVIGGEKKKSEKARLRKGVNILIATPGRLVDHIDNTDNLKLGYVRYLVMDEGDRLMELGFEENIKRILAKLNEDFDSNLGPMQDILPKKRINVLCSATLKGNVKKLGEISLENGGEIISAQKGTDVEDHMKAPDQLVQRIVVVPPKLRYVTLAAVLKNVSKIGKKTIVFISCADSVDFHFIALINNGQFVRKDDIQGSSAPDINDNTIIYKLHGSLSQRARTNTLNDFIKDDSEKGKILICTDVASRGLDLPNIDEVIEFDPPFTINDHLHRIGRTARLGKEGESWLFLMPGLEENYIEIIKPLHKKSQMQFESYEKVLEDGFAKIEDDPSTDSKLKGNKFNRVGSWDMHATTFQLNLERRVINEGRIKEMCEKAFLSHMRAYTTHLNEERGIFNIKDLHLGHLAKSFGLRERPKAIGGGNEGVKRKKLSGKNLVFKKAREAQKENEFNLA